MHIKYTCFYYWDCLFIGGGRYVPGSSSESNARLAADPFTGITFLKVVKASESCFIDQAITVHFKYVNILMA